MKSSIYTQYSPTNCIGLLPVQKYIGEASASAVKVCTTPAENTAQMCSTRGGPLDGSHDMYRGSAGEYHCWLEPVPHHVTPSPSHTHTHSLPCTHRQRQAAEIPQIAGVPQLLKKNICAHCLPSCSPRDLFTSHNIILLGKTQEKIPGQRLGPPPSQRRASSTGAGDQR